MHPDDVTTDAPELSAESLSVRPRASTWLWRPWYAKLWWVCIGIYWAGKLVSYWRPWLDDAYSTALAGYLNIAFYPFVALLILGVRFVTAWMEYRNWEWVEPSHERMFPKRSVGGYLDPMADPLDPRSPKHWRYLDDIK